MNYWSRVLARRSAKKDVFLILCKGFRWIVFERAFYNTFFPAASELYFYRKEAWSKLLYKHFRKSFQRKKDHCKTWQTGWQGGGGGRQQFRFSRSGVQHNLFFLSTRYLHTRGICFCWILQIRKHELHQEVNSAECAAPPSPCIWSQALTRLFETF